MEDESTIQNALWYNFFRRKKEDDNSVESLLGRIPIFSQLTDRELGKLAGIVHRREYSADELIFSQSDPGLGMYVIEEGTVRILIAEDGGAGRELTVLHGGDFFGELSLLDESPRSASALAASNCRIIGFFRPDLIDLLNRSPKMGTKILFRLGEVIGTRLRITNERLANVSAGSEGVTSSKGGAKNVGGKS